jgi:hypothetical protein
VLLLVFGYAACAPYHDLEMFAALVLLLRRYRNQLANLLDVTNNKARQSNSQEG